MSTEITQLQHLYESNGSLTDSQETNQKLHELITQSHQCYDDCYKEQNEELKKKCRQKYQESKETLSHFFIDVIINNDAPRAVPSEFPNYPNPSDVQEENIFFPY
jgi:hypothetical protein